MNKLGILKNISLLIALVAVVYIVGNYSGLAKSTVMQLLNIPGSSVQGISTSKAQEITGKIQSDLSWQAGAVQDQLLNLTLGDVVGVLSRAQKIPKDFRAVEAYTKEKIDEVLKPKK